MITITVGDLKTRFSDILKKVQLGEEIAIAFGRKKEVLAYIVPKKYKEQQAQRPLGLLDGKTRVFIAEDFEVTEADFLNL